MDALIVLYRDSHVTLFVLGHIELKRVRVVRRVYHHA